MLNDLLKNAFLQPVEQQIIVKAEELPVGGGVNFKDTFFEPQVGKDYIIKFIQNVEQPLKDAAGNDLGGGENLTHRKIYKDLPDPQRKGKTFQFISSGSASTCKALELFFELNKEKKEGNVVSASKIEEFMGATNQGCTVIQIIDSPEKEEIGQYRLFTFSTFGPNATIANLLNQKLNPTESQLKAGFVKENVFDLFESSVMLLSCVESTYDGQKGRDFSKSSWGPAKRGAFVVLNDETKEVHQFSKADVVNGDFATPKAQEAFMKVIETLQNPKLSVHNFFAYKLPDDPRNTPETKNYLENLYKKVDEIIPIIRNAKSVGEVKQYGKVDNSAQQGSTDGATDIGSGNAADILKESIPELSGSVLNQAANVASETPNPVVNQAPEISADVADILGS